MFIGHSERPAANGMGNLSAQGSSVRNYTSINGLATVSNNAAGLNKLP